LARHAHVGWLFRPDPPQLNRSVSDLATDRLLSKIDDLFVVWVLLGLVIPAAVGGAVTGSWSGACSGLPWGGLVRMCLAHHLTWSVNSVCHIWGRRPFESHDHSTNNFAVADFTFGEGWHNNHHAFPTSARHGLRWWQLDFAYLFIRELGLLGPRMGRAPSREICNRAEAARESTVAMSRHTHANV